MGLSRRGFLGIAGTGAARTAVTVATGNVLPQSGEGSAASGAIADAARAKSRIDLGSAWKTAREYVSRYRGTVPASDQLGSVITSGNFETAVVTWDSILSAGEQKILDAAAEHRSMFGASPSWSDMISAADLGVLKNAGLSPDQPITAEGLRLLRGLNHEGMMQRAGVMSRLHEVAVRGVQRLKGEGHDEKEARSIVRTMLETAGQPASDLDYLASPDSAFDLSRLGGVADQLETNTSALLAQATREHTRKLAENGGNISFLDKWFEGMGEKLQLAVERMFDDKVFLKLGDTEEEAQRKLGVVGELVQLRNPMFGFENSEHAFPTRLICHTVELPTEQDGMAAGGIPEMHMSSAPQAEAQGQAAVVDVPLAIAEPTRYTSWGIELDGTQFHEFTAALERFPNIAAAVGFTSAPVVQQARRLG